MGMNRSSSVSVRGQKEPISALGQHQSTELYRLPVAADEEQLVTVVTGHYLYDSG